MQFSAETAQKTNSYKHVLIYSASGHGNQQIVYKKNITYSIIKTSTVTFCYRFQCLWYALVFRTVKIGCLFVAVLLCSILNNLTCSLLFHVVYVCNDKKECLICI